MPAALATVLISYGGVVITVGQVLFAVASFAISSTMASRAQKQAEEKQRASADAQRAAYNAGLTDRTSVNRGAIVPRNILLGRDEVSGPLICWFTYGPLRNFHAFAIALVGHEIDAIESICFNHEVVTLDGAGAVTDTKYCRPFLYTYYQQYNGPGTAGTAIVLGRPATRVISVAYAVPGSAEGTVDTVLAPYTLSVDGSTITLTADVPGSRTVNINYEVSGFETLFRIKKYLGAPGQTAAPELIAAAAAAGLPTAWDATRKGTSVAYITVVMEADFNILGQLGVPNVSVIARGAKCFDPRTALTAWTQNPALQARWFNVDSGYAPKTLDSEINAANLLASANVSDEVIAFAADRMEARYTSNGQLTTAASPMDNLNHILDAMDGDAVWVSGQWQIYAGYHRASTLTIDEDSLSGANITVVPRTAKRDLFNAMTGTFVSPAAGYVRTSYTMVTSAVYQAEDGDELLPADASFELVNDAIRCQMIAWQRLTRARQPLTVSLGSTLKGYDTAPQQNLTLNLRRPGYTNKLFNNVRREHDRNTLTHVLQETGPEVWAWDYTKADAAVDIPNTSFPDVTTIPVPQGITIDSGSALLQRLENGTLISRGRINWLLITNTYVVNGGYIEWQYKSAMAASDAWVSMPRANGDDTSITTSALTDGDLMLVRGRCVTAQGRQGVWSPVVTFTVIGKTENPLPPALVAATPAFAVFSLSPDLDIAGYEIRYKAGAGTDGSVATALHVVNGVQGLVAGSPWPMPVQLFGINTTFVRAVDSGGRVSPWAYDTQNFGLPAAANIADLVDFDALGFPGIKTNATVVGGDLVATADPSSDYWGGGLGEDFWYRDGAADFWGSAQYLQLVYTATYACPYAGGALLLDIVASGARVTVEYRIDGGSVGDFWADGDGDGDFWAGASFYGTDQAWQPWPGVVTPTVAGQGLQFRISIDAGSVQGILDQFALRTEMPTISQTFGNVLINAAGTTLLPSAGVPPLSFIQVLDVQVTPIVDGSGAVTGRAKGTPTPAGIPVEILNSAAAAVTGHAFVSASGY